jgi:hypothetical protein
LKIGYTEGDTVQRIAAQISTSTPDRPVLYVEIKTNACRALERAILETRGRKIDGAGAEWFKATPQEILTIHKFVVETIAAQNSIKNSWPVGRNSEAFRAGLFALPILRLWSRSCWRPLRRSSRARLS